jgi:pimeloyl-ACP methyl ester carboxylesterase
MRGVAALAAVGASGMAGCDLGSEKAESTSTRQIGVPASPLTAGAAFGPVRQIDAGVLNVGYVDSGPVRGPAVVLMHGFRYDIHGYVEVAPLLAAAGYRVIVPYFRGHGATTFQSEATPWHVDQAAFALDTLALMDALHIDIAILAGYDWGTRTGNIIAALSPERVKALVAGTGYLIVDLAANKLPQPPKAENAYWYQFYFATPRGELGLAKYRQELGEFIWKFDSPTWNFSQGRTTRLQQRSPTLTMSIVIGNYRWRLRLALAEPEYAAIEGQLQAGPTIGVPTITVDGKYDPFTPPGDGSLYRHKFSGKYEHRVFPVGHNLPQEDPHGFVQAVVDVDRF